MKQEATKNQRSNGGGRLAGAGLLLSLAVILAVANRGWLRDRLTALKLVPTPDRYTELYFPQHLLLPTTAGADPVKFSFTIHNEEGTVTNYPYLIVLMMPDGKTQTLVTGTTVLTNGQARTLPVTIGLPAKTTTAEVAVVLPSQQESIHFWIGAAS